MNSFTTKRLYRDCAIGTLLHGEDVTASAPRVWFLPTMGRLWLWPHWRSRDRDASGFPDRSVCRHGRASAGYHGLSGAGGRFVRRAAAGRLRSTQVRVLTDILIETFSSAASRVNVAGLHDHLQSEAQICLRHAIRASRRMSAVSQEQLKSGHVVMSRVGSRLCENPTDGRLPS